LQNVDGEGCSAGALEPWRAHRLRDQFILLEHVILRIRGFVRLYNMAQRAIRTLRNQSRS
jgi:hypothetical protein